MSYLKLEGIYKSFSKTPVLRDINLEINARTFCVILGPSGCGKSTLLNIIAGLTEPEQGRVVLDSTDITYLAPHKRDIAMVFQNYALYPHLSVYENMAFGLRARGFKDDVIYNKVSKVSRILGIEDKLDLFPRQLSGGQRQRVATGRAIVRNPKLFLFDEPLSNLDARLRLELRKEFIRLKNLMATSLYVTHDQSEALALGDLIVVIKDSIIQQVSSAQKLYDEPINLFVASFIGTPSMNIIEGIVQRENGRLVFKSASLLLGVPHQMQSRLAEYAGRVVYFGIRPQALSFSDTGPSGKILFIENLGEGGLAHVELSSKVQMKVVIKESRMHHSQELVNLRFDCSKMYFFDSNRRRII